MVLFCGAPAAADPPPPTTHARVDAELFTGYRYTDTGAASAHEFDLDRGELGLSLDWAGILGGELRVETVRSASPESLMGIDGDSLVLRAKRAWGSARLDRGPVVAEVRAGLVTDPWIEALDRAFDHRAVDPSLAERAAWIDASDLGAVAAGSLYGDRLRLALAFGNGEGRRRLEQNEGKNLTAVLAGRPLRGTLRGEEAHVDVLLLARDGSAGPGSSRSHRFGAAIAFDLGLARGGIEVQRALGAGGRSAIEAEGLGAWLAATWRPWRVGLVARLDELDLDRARADTGRQIVTAGAWVDPAPSWVPRDARLRLYVLAQDERFGPQASTVPGVVEAFGATRLLVTLVVAGGLGDPSAPGPRP
jgi:hypothetical protein